MNDGKEEKYLVTITAKRQGTAQTRPLEKQYYRPTITRVGTAGSRASKACASEKTHKVNRRRKFGSFKT